jgi:predicted Zn-dependent protease
MYHVNLAGGLLKTKAYPEAVKQCTEALRIEPDNVDAQCILGAARLEMGQFDSAVAGLNEALRRNPGNSKIEALLRRFEARIQKKTASSATAPG